MKWKPTIAVVLAVLLAFGSIAYALTVHKEVLFQGTIVDELEDIDIFSDAACTTLAEVIPVGDLNRGSEYVFRLYAKNLSDTRTTDVLAEVFGADVVLFDGGLAVAPTSVPMNPGQVVEFQVAVIVPTSAPLGDVEWGVRFYSDPDSSPAGVPLNMPDAPGALFDYWAPSSGIVDIPGAPAAPSAGCGPISRFMCRMGL